MSLATKFPSMSAVTEGPLRDVYANPLIFRSDSKVSSDTLNSLGIRWDMLKGWRTKIDEIKELQQAGRDRGQLRLGLPAPEALRQMFNSKNFGRAERHYKEMQDEVMVFLSDYRVA